MGAQRVIKVNIVATRLVCDFICQYCAVRLYERRIFDHQSNYASTGVQGTHPSCGTSISCQESRGKHHRNISDVGSWKEVCSRAYSRWLRVVSHSYL
jgi:hypothetical protein